MIWASHGVCSERGRRLSSCWSNTKNGTEIAVFRKTMNKIRRLANGSIFNAEERTLANEHRAKLDDLGFAWSVKRTWGENFQLLVQYKEQHGHCNVPQRYEPDPTLGHWVINQRIRKDYLSNEQRVKLDDLGFSWSLKRTWEETFQLLVQYKEQHGDCNVPQNYEQDLSSLGK
jgi:Helicase associated domain